jgi:hypothetical protein
MAEQEYSESGEPIYRYDHVKPKDFTLAIGDTSNIEAISGHIEKNIGKIDGVFHEIVSDLVHIDVHWVKPTEKFPFHSLITSGMSDLPMAAPEGFEAHKYTELCILLPKDWPIDWTDYQTTEEVFKEERNYWPVRWLKTIARFPHEYNTWVSHSHTIPNGENADPYADNTGFGCMILLPGLSLGPAFLHLKINDEKTITFYCLYPLYKEEMELKLKKGSDALIDKFEKYHVTDIFDIERPNTCLKKGLWGLW